MLIKQSYAHQPGLCHAFQYNYNLRTQIMTISFSVLIFSSYFWSSQRSHFYFLSLTAPLTTQKPSMINRYNNHHLSSLQLYNDYPSKTNHILLTYSSIEILCHKSKVRVLRCSLSKWEPTMQSKWQPGLPPFPIRKSNCYKYFYEKPKNNANFFL